MGRRGPAPKSADEQALAGNPGKRRAAPDGPALPVGVPRCPASLRPAAKAEWRRVVKILAPLNILSPADQRVLACYCSAVAQLDEIEELLAREGLTTTTEKGATKAHPAVAMQRSAWAAVLRFAAVIGLDPAARMRVKAPPPAEEKDEFAEFLKGKA